MLPLSTDVPHNIEQRFETGQRVGARDRDVSRQVPGRAAAHPYRSGSRRRDPRHDLGHPWSGDPHHARRERLRRRHHPQQGLDHTHTWGRTYWGQTENRHSVQDAVSAVVAAGGNTEVDWPLTQVLNGADQATGVHVLSDLYQQVSATPVEIDLYDLWRRLGVALSDGKVVFDNTMPLSEIRQAITRTPDA